MQQPSLNHILEAQILTTLSQNNCLSIKQKSTGRIIVINNPRQDLLGFQMEGSFNIQTIASP